MKTLKLNFIIMMSCLIALSLTFSTVNTFGQKTDSTKTKALIKIKAIVKETTYNTMCVKKIYRIAKRAKLNFDTYIHTADLAHTIGYHTVPLVTIAKYASNAKVETNYFIQLADLVVMKLSGTQQMLDIALEVSKLTTATNADIDKKIQELQKTTDYKTLEEAKAASKAEIDKMNKKK